MFKQGVRDGIGRFDFKESISETDSTATGQTTGTYQGDWKAGQYHGHGCIVWRRKSLSYTGNWFHGKKHGSGTMKRFYSDGTEGEILQEGTWEMDVFEEDSLHHTTSKITSTLAAVDVSKKDGDSFENK